MTVSALHSIASVDGSRALTRAAVLHHCGRMMLGNAERTYEGGAGGGTESRWNRGDAMVIEQAVHCITVN